MRIDQQLSRSRCMHLLTIGSIRARGGCLLVLAVAVVGCGEGSRVAGSDGSSMQAADADAGLGFDASSAPPTVIPCRQDFDCPQPGNYCEPCFDGGVSCANSRCTDGGCVDVPASCPGPISEPCFGKSCGETCEQCSISDGGCYSGTCDYLGRACRALAPRCSFDGGVPTTEQVQGCTAFDAVAAGYCNHVFGWAWNGLKCVPIVGCLCEGSDCGYLLDYFTCLIFESCPHDGGPEM
jgi:hypothetical protein